MDGDHSEVTVDYYFVAMAESRLGNREQAVKTCLKVRHFIDSEEFPDYERRRAELVLEEAARELNLPSNDPSVAPPWPTIHETHRSYRTTRNTTADRKKSSVTSVLGGEQSAFYDVVRLAEEQHFDEAKGICGRHGRAGQWP